MPFAAPHHIDGHLSSSGSSREGHALIHHKHRQIQLPAHLSVQRNRLWAATGYWARRVIPLCYDAGSRTPSVKTFSSLPLP